MKRIGKGEEEEGERRRRREQAIWEKGSKGEGRENGGL